MEVDELEARLAQQAGSVLVVEDDRPLSAVLVRLLSREGYAVDTAFDGQRGLHLALTRTYTLMVLDRTLPAIEGLDLLARLRARGVTVPVLVLSALSSARERVQGLDAGAEDYLTKPFDTGELMARLRALRRRHAETSRDLRLPFGRLVVASHEVVGADGDTVTLTTRECDLLETLARRPRQIFSQEELMDTTFPDAFDHGLVSVYVHHLRRGSRRLSSRPVAVVVTSMLVLMGTGLGPGSGLGSLFRPSAAEARTPTSTIDNTVVPHYFGPYPNWANTPQTLADAMVKINVGTPTPVSFGNPLTERKYATDYAKPTGEMGPVLVVLEHTKLPAGTLNDFQSWNQGTAGASPTTSAGNLFHALVLRPTASTGEFTVVYTSDELKVPKPTVDTGEVETYPLSTPVAVQKGDVIGFYGEGVPVDTEVLANGDTLSTPASGDPSLATNVAPAKNSTVKLGDPGYPDFSHDRTYSFAADVTPTVADPGTGAEATATVDPKTGAITGVDVTSPGAGYAISPTVTITTAGVTPTTVANATATIATGVINAIDVNETGFGFTAPTVTLTGGNPTAGFEAKALASGVVDDLKLTDGGTGYQAQPLVTLTKPDLPGGTQATASATMDAKGVVTGVTIANPGSGYTAAPTVTVTDASKNDPTKFATVTATIGVTKIDITDGGQGLRLRPHRHHC